MSLFGAMTTAISGLTSQSDAFANISDSVANSQTIGYKRIDTSFINYLTQSDAKTNISGATVATPLYQNTVQGTITQTQDPLNIAITGQGFFQTSQQDGTTTSATTGATSPTFSTQAYYTRAGDFTLDKNNYIVNSEGDYLNGWSVTDNVVNESAVAPIQITNLVSAPTQTSTVTLSANLPSTTTTAAATASAVASQVAVYDSLGNSHVIDMSWLPSSTTVGNWTLTLSSPDNIGNSSGGTLIGSCDVQFNTNGTIESIGANASSGDLTVPSSYSTDATASLSFDAYFGANGSTQPQAVTLNLGNYGESTGMTQYQGTSYALRSLTQDGYAPGSYSSVSIDSTGDVTVNYTNGQEDTVARVPVVTFANPDDLQRQNGQNFTQTLTSGDPISNTAGAGGAGSLINSAVEASNVDIATEFSNLIQAQQAYSANAKVITTADDMLTTTVNMKR